MAPNATTRRGWSATATRSSAARLAARSWSSEGRPRPGRCRSWSDEATFACRWATVIDLEAEAARLEREIGKLDGEAAKIEQKLANREFLARAPAEVVEQQRERLDEIEEPARAPRSRRWRASA